MPVQDTGGRGRLLKAFQEGAAAQGTLGGGMEGGREVLKNLALEALSLFLKGSLGNP